MLVSLICLALGAAPVPAEDSPTDGPREKARIPAAAAGLLAVGGAVAYAIGTNQGARIRAGEGSFATAAALGDGIRTARGTQTVGVALWAAAVTALATSSVMFFFAPRDSVAIGVSPTGIVFAGALP